ncbi:MAG: hypothetical protein ACYTGA_10155, partial [Planctomycetota bacterium]
MVTLGVPLIITVLTEYPAIKLFYNPLLSLKKSLLVAIKINIISYAAFCFLMTPFYLTGIAKRSEHLDQKRLSEWNHIELLDDEYGCVYKINLVDKNYILSRYDLSEKIWEEVYKVGKRECNIDIWDISNRYFVFTDLKSSGEIHIADNGSFESVRLIENIGECKKIKISPSQESIAVLEDVGEVVVQKKKGGWFQTLGSRCRLLVFDIKTGQVICEYERPVLSSEISWSPDSKKILFETL